MIRWGSDPEPGPSAGIVGGAALVASVACWGLLLVALAVRIAEARGL